MLDGALWERVTLARPTSDTGSGSLPTPVKYDSHGTWESNNYHGLGWSAKHVWAKDPEREQFPTPIRSDSAVGKALKVLIDVEQGTAFNQLAREVRKREHVARGTWPVRAQDGPVRPRGLLDLSDMPEAPNGRATRPWPTPMCTGLRGGSGAPKDLDQRLRLFPTPVSSDNRKKMVNVPMTLSARGYPQAVRECGTGKQVNLSAAVLRFPTPTSVNGMRGGSESEHWPGKWQSPGHPEYGELNPRWVEWLMDWPIGWTSLDPLPEGSFEHWLATSLCDETGTAPWWRVDPSGDGSIPRTVGKDDPFREERIAALGNGQVPAAAAASFLHLINLDEPGDTR
jgi:hypothetical protein